MERAHGRRGQSRLGGHGAGACPAGLDRDPQVAGVAALQLLDDRRTRGEPPAQHVHGAAAERIRGALEVQVRRRVQVQRADLEVGQLGHRLAGLGDQRGHGSGPQRRGGAGVQRPAGRQLGQQLVRLAGGDPVAARRRLGVAAVRHADEAGEAVVAVDAHPHRVAVGGGTGAAQGVAGAGLARGRVGEPGVAALGLEELGGGELGPGGLLGMLQVLLQEAPADPLGGGGEAAVCHVTDELVDDRAGGLVGRGCHKPGA
jgi:hypothetical protein